MSSWRHHACSSLTSDATRTDNWLRDANGKNGWLGTQLDRINESLDDNFFRLNKTSSLSLDKSLSLMLPPGCVTSMSFRPVSWKKNLQLVITSYRIDAIKHLLCFLWSLFHHGWQIAYAFLPELQYYGLPIITSKEIVECTIMSYKENVNEPFCLQSQFSLVSNTNSAIGGWFALQLLLRL